MKIGGIKNMTQIFEPNMYSDKSQEKHTESRIEHKRTPNDITKVIEKRKPTPPARRNILKATKDNVEDSRGEKQKPTNKTKERLIKYDFRSLSDDEGDSDRSLPDPDNIGYNWASRDKINQFDNFNDDNNQNRNKQVCDENSDTDGTQSQIDREYNREEIQSNAPYTDEYDNLSSEFQESENDEDGMR